MKINRKFFWIIISSAIIIITISLLLIFAVVYIYPTSLTPPTRLAGQYNDKVGRLGFGFFDIVVNGQSVGEGEPVIIHDNNMVGVTTAINHSVFKNIDIKIFVDNKLITRKLCQKNDSDLQFDMLTITGSSKNNGMTLKILLTGYRSEDSLGFKKDTKFQAYQSNYIVYERQSVGN